MHNDCRNLAIAYTLSVYPFLARFREYYSRRTRPLNKVRRALGIPGLISQFHRRFTVISKILPCESREGSHAFVFLHRVQICIYAGYIFYLDAPCQDFPRKRRFTNYICFTPAEYALSSTNSNEKS